MIGGANDRRAMCITSMHKFPWMRHGRHQHLQRDSRIAKASLLLFCGNGQCEKSLPLSHCRLEWSLRRRHINWSTTTDGQMPEFLVMDGACVPVFVPEHNVWRNTHCVTLFLTDPVTLLTPASSAHLSALVRPLSRHRVKHKKPRAEKPPRERKHIGEAFRIPSSHMKGYGSVLCISPIQGSFHQADKADDLTLFKSHIRQLLDVKGLLFWGAAING